MLSERELIEMATTYRDMAKQARDPHFKLEFAERADRYETAVSAVRRTQPTRPDATKESGSPRN